MTSSPLRTVEIAAVPTPVETVTAFLAFGDAPGAFARAIQAYFTADSVWENVGMSKTTGVDEAMAVLSGFGMDAASLAMRIDILAIAAQGDTVLTERIDHILDATGTSTHAFPVMGAFEVKGGKIAAWRDYFDTAAWTQGMPS
jgi:limonene-1,2-epoxide hydrolase